MRKIIKKMRKKFYCKNTQKLFKMANSSPNKAVNFSPYALVHVKKVDYFIALDAVIKDGICLRDVPWWHRDKHMCLTALYEDTKSWTYVPKSIQDEILKDKHHITNLNLHP